MSTNRFKNYYQKNKLKILLNKKKYYIKNKEKSNRRSRLWHKNNIKRSRVLHRKWSKSNPEKIRKYSLKNRYKLTIEDYNNLLIEQKYCCAICSKHSNKLKKKLFVDHDHKTGNVRGLLCFKCNFGLGYMNDSSTQLIKAANYLIR